MVMSSTENKRKPELYAEHHTKNSPRIGVSARDGDPYELRTLPSKGVVEHDVKV